MENYSHNNFWTFPIRKLTINQGLDSLDLNEKLYSEALLYFLTGIRQWQTGDLQSFWLPPLEVTIPLIEEPSSFLIINTLHFILSIPDRVMRLEVLHFSKTEKG